MGSDPIKARLVESLGRPGRNATGFTVLTNELEPKRLGLLRDLLPGAGAIGVLVNPNFPPAAGQLKALEKAAQTLAQKLDVAEQVTMPNWTRAWLVIQHGVSAVLVAADPFFDTRRDRIISFTAHNKLPAIYQFREYAVAGGLISYGPSITDAYRQAGIYVGQILKGAKPADLPVVQPTKYELVINLKTAKCSAWSFRRASYRLQTR